MIVGFYKRLIAGFTLTRTRIKGLTSLRLASKNWKTTNLEILKFEARFAYAVKF